MFAPFTFEQTFPNFVLTGLNGAPDQFIFESSDVSGSNLILYYTSSNAIYATSTTDFIIRNGASLLANGEVISDRVTSVGEYAFSLIKSIYLPNCITINKSAVDGASAGVELLYLPKVTTIGENAFKDVFISGSSYPNVLTSISLPSATHISSSVFEVTSANISSSITSYYLPSLSGSTGLGGTTGSDNVFGNAPISGSITVPSFYSSSNGGSPDGDLQYLASRGWTITYI